MSGLQSSTGGSDVPLGLRATSVGQLKGTQNVKIWNERIATHSSNRRITMACPDLERTELVS